MTTFADSESNASVRAKINAAITTVDNLVANGASTDARYATRQEFVNAVAGGLSLADGSLVAAAGFLYEADSTSTDIADLTGFKPFGTVYPDHWAENLVRGTTDMTAAIQAAIDYVSVQSGADGGTVHLTRGDYGHTGINLKSHVFLRGEGRGATQLYLLDGSNTASVTVGAGIDVFGWSCLTINGNRAGNTSGDGVFFEAAASGGQYNSEAVRTTSATRSYKHCIATDFAVASCAGHNINISAANYKVFFDNFSSFHSGGDGMRVFCSDGIFSNFYLERCDDAALYASGSNNKFSNGKAIWSGRVDNSFAGVYVISSYNSFVNVEAQDNYCDGWSIGGVGNKFVGCSSNRNGYLSVGNEDQSSRIHADVRVRTTSVGTTATGFRVYTYATSVGSDGFWTTEWPVYFDGFAVSQIYQWDIQEIDATKYNQASNFTMSGSDANGEYVRHNDGTMTVWSTVQYDSDVSGQIAAGASQTATWTIPGSSEVPFLADTAQAQVHSTNAAGTTTTFVQAATNFGTATQRVPTTTCVWSVQNFAAISRPIRVFLTAKGRWR